MPAIKEPFIRIEGLHYTYQTETETPEYVLNGVDLTINTGDYIAIIGANGSGKSTLLRHLNALLVPTLGNVWISGWNTRDSSNVRNIRSIIGMVFQAPETQIAATIVEEDVAFGPENLGVPEDELRNRVDWALSVVGLSSVRDRPSHLLSAGQKQLLAIAGALSMKTGCLAVDEATSMLDPSARYRFIETIDQLHKQGMTIITVTHNMDEAALARRVIVLSEGRIALQGSPGFVFSQAEALKALKLALPAPARLARKIAELEIDFPGNILTVSGLLGDIIRYLEQKRGVNG